MSLELTITDLQQSLLKRAGDLAQEIKQRAQRSHDHFIEDENERLQMREEREVMAAKMQAERVFRSRVQASELTTQKQLDQLRWQLIRDVLDEVKQAMMAAKQDENQYRRIILEFIREAVNNIPEQALRVQFNAADYDFFKPHWQTITQALTTAFSIEMSDQHHHFSGGVMIYNQGNSIRLDNTFEGRLERYSEELHQIIAETFFSELSHEGEKIHGR